MYVVYTSQKCMSIASFTVYDTIMTMTKGRLGRTKDEREAHMARVAELKLQHMSDQEISAIIFNEFGVLLSRRMINYDVNRIREKWQQTQMDSYDALINEALAKMDILEKEAWELLRTGSGKRFQRITNKSLRRKKHGDSDDQQDDEEVGDLVVTGVQETEAHDEQAKLAILDSIMKIQQERNRLRGLYPSRGGNIQQNIIIKGYSAAANPDQWPSAIDGEFESYTDTRLLTDARE